MQKLFLSLSIVFVSFTVMAQKKPLDHTVYDGWQSIGEKAISNNGQLVVYTITPQEGDAILVIQSTNGNKLLEIPRGYNAKFSANGNFLVCKIKPTYQQTREAKIKKKKADEQPKDSLAIITVSNLKVEKFARLKSYKIAEEGNWLAWLYEKNENDKKRDDDEGTLLCMRNLNSAKNDSINKVTDYLFDKKGNNFVYEVVPNKKDSVLKPAIIWLKTNNKLTDTLLKNFADAKAYSFDEDGNQLAFVATNDTGKTEQKNYTLYAKTLNESLSIVNGQKGITTNWRINENATISFSKTGNRVFFGTSPKLPAKDTSLPEFERVNVDVWHYNDDDLQPVQLKNLDADLKKSYTAMYDYTTKEILQLGNESFERITTTLEGDGTTFYTQTDAGKRVQQQWQGFTLKDLYAIDARTGKETLIQKNFKGVTYPSYTGKYLLLYDEVKKQFSSYNSTTQQTNVVAKDIAYPLYNEENDVPDDADAYGIVKWMENDKYVLVYDKYDVWKVDPTGKEKSVAITSGRKDKEQYRFVNVDADEKYITNQTNLVFRNFNEANKNSGLAIVSFNNKKQLLQGNYSISGITKAKNADVFFYALETFKESANLYINKIDSEVKLTNTNPQQASYNWGTAELFKWKAYTGKETEGILYKPEDFDAKKKYPMIVYFYERSNNTLYNYIAPSPTPSRLNISFFVSRGYIVFVPDIWYKTGKPGQSAFDYILSGTRAVAKLGFVDTTKIGLQGQSWGGYQIAHLITRTKLYAAAWAGAPVANMTSAYGGIRWGSGVTRQFQYEKQQSRIGATLWERTDLYLENSPLFHLPKVTTPLVIMANDKDDAVPWYQGIELFTAMRRLNKKVWMLNYNDEVHNLAERKNRKDIQIREQQFFDWLLKGEKPATWLSDGLPATMKGRTWGL